MLKIDPWNIIWTVVNLLFLYWIFKKFLFDRVMGVNQSERRNDSEAVLGSKERVRTMQKA